MFTKFDKAIAAAIGAPLSQLLVIAIEFAVPLNAEAEVGVAALVIALLTWLVPNK